MEPGGKLELGDRLELGVNLESPQVALVTGASGGIGENPARVTWHYNPHTPLI